MDVFFVIFFSQRRNR